MRTLRIATLVIATFATSHAAHAQEDPRKAAAQPVFEEGLRLHDANKEQEALAAFQRAYATYPSPNVLFEIARTKRLLNRFVEALRDFRAATKDALLHPKNRDIAQKHIRELEPMLARIEIVGPAGAKVKIADLELTLPMSEPVDVEPGLTTASAGLGRSRYEGRVNARAGATTRLELMLLGTEGSDDAGTVATPPSDAASTPTGSAARWLVPGAIGVVGLVGIGLGVGVGLKSQSTNDDFNALDCTRRANPECGSLQERSQDEKAVSLAGYIGGGTLLAGAAVLWAVWPSPSSAKGASHVVPILTGEQQGAAWVGRF